MTKYLRKQIFFILGYLQVEVQHSEDEDMNSFRICNNRKIYLTVPLNAVKMRENSV